MRKNKAAALLAMGAVSALVLAGCAAETETDTGTDTGSDNGSSDSAPASEFAALDLSGIDIAVGSKQFPEQLILGEMLVASFEEAGANVENKVNLGGTAVSREALLAGDIDIQPDYNGTGWATHLGQDEPALGDPDELTEKVAALDLEENDIVWVGRSPFNNTYAFTSSPELTEENGGAFTLESMMQYVQDNPDAVVCMESEYPDRADGLVLLEEYSGQTIPQDQRRILDFGIIYTETAANNCDFGEVYTTDGRISALGLTLVEDPGVHYLYNISGSMVGETYRQAPDVFDEIINSMLEPLTNERMGSLEARVSVDGEEASTVARDYLRTEGLIE